MNNEWDENMESGNGILGEDEVFGENRAEQETAADATWQSGQAEEYQQNWQTGSEF